MTDLFVRDAEAPDTVPPGPGAGTAWVDVCPLERLQPDRGVCALVAGRAVAVFRLSGTDEVCAIDNIDPFADASVLSRGLVGAARIGDDWVPYVASPLRKQRFDLRTGTCLDDPSIAVDTHAVRVGDGRVLVAEPVAAVDDGRAGG